MSIATTLVAWLLRRPAPMCEDGGVGADLTLTPLETDADALPGGCGWFFSSLDLRSGLAVIEHDRIDAGALLALELDAELVLC